MLADWFGAFLAAAAAWDERAVRVCEAEAGLLGLAVTNEDEGASHGEPPSRGR